MSRLARRAAALLRATTVAGLRPPRGRAAAAWPCAPAALGEARAWPAAAPWGGASPRGFAAAAGGSGDEGEAEEEADVSQKEVLRKHTELALRLGKEEERRSATARARAEAQQRKAGGGAAQGAAGDKSPGAGGGGKVPQRQRSLLERLEGMSRKQQQFALAQELMGRGEVSREVATKVFLQAQALAEEAPDGFDSLKDVIRDWEHAASLEEKPDPMRPQDRELDMHVVNINRTVKVTKSGSLQRFTALVVVGNRAGAVGWALGKSPDVPGAVDKAYARAARHLFFFPRYAEHTIFHSTQAKYGATHITLDPLPAGSGLKANTTVQAVCRLAGIRNVRAKVVGSHNPHTTLRALFDALDAVRTPAEVAAARGRAVLETVPRRKRSS